MKERAIIIYFPLVKVMRYELNCICKDKAEWMGDQPGDNDLPPSSQRQLARAEVRAVQTHPASIFMRMMWIPPALNLTTRKGEYRRGRARPCRADVECWGAWRRRVAFSSLGRG